MTAPTRERHPGQGGASDDLAGGSIEPHCTPTTGHDRRARVIVDLARIVPIAEGFLPDTAFVQLESVRIRPGELRTVAGDDAA